jgi:acyl-CoA synthetase (NDP forming)
MPPSPLERARSSRSRPAFGEVSDEGRARERAVVERVREAGAVLLGPNCLGVYDAGAELDLSSSDFVPGPIGVISQSGNLAIELSLLASEVGLGISRFASLGNQADLEAAELVGELAAHDSTRVIAVYLEDFRDGRAFARASAGAGAGGAARTSDGRKRAARRRLPAARARRAHRLTAPRAGEWPGR